MFLSRKIEFWEKVIIKSTNEIKVKNNKIKTEDFTIEGRIVLARKNEVHFEFATVYSKNNNSKKMEQNNITTANDIRIYRYNKYQVHEEINKLKPDRNSWEYQELYREIMEKIQHKRELEKKRGELEKKRIEEQSPIIRFAVYIIFLAQINDRRHSNTIKIIRYIENLQYYKNHAGEKRGVFIDFCLTEKKLPKRIELDLLEKTLKFPDIYFFSNMISLVRFTHVFNLYKRISNALLDND